MRRAVAVATLATVAGALAGPSMSGGASTEPTVNVTDNAFTRGGVQRPAVKIKRGQRVVWRWASQQSHGISVRSGPDRKFRVAPRTRGRAYYRFTQTGTYLLECPLHAPGMKMTVVVRR